MGGRHSRQRNFDAPPPQPIEYYPEIDPLYNTYQHIGYLINEEANEDVARNSWRIFGKHTGNWEKIDNRWTMLAEFYITPTNVNYEDIQIQLNNGMVKGYRLTDIKSIPPQLELDSPQLNTGPYKFVELPKREFSSRFYI